MPSEEEIKQIQETTTVLEEEFPLEKQYGTKASLWYEGLKAELVTEDLYYKAARYYGDIWNQFGVIRKENCYE